MAQLDIYGQTATELIESGENLFITGKAGTGKTYTLKELIRRFERKKRLVVLAPTGVAAKNAGGVTIHSFLHLPLSPYIPGMKIRSLYTLSPEDEELVKRIDLMIIDEVSMVRCDLLDMVDDVLRHYRENDEPFGGVQVVMFGDLYQLMPVATEEDWEKLKEHYESPYFFSSKVLQETDCPIFELKKIHRQNDINFKALLNNVRRGKVNYQELDQLQKRFIKDFVPKDEDGYIRLTTHNSKSSRYNASRLADLKTTEYTYKAYIEDGYLSKEEWPNDYYLRLKKGARVMFIRNDRDHRYVNGTLGWITDLGDWGITVKTDEGLTVDVERQTWDFYKYYLNKQTNTIESMLYASFKQYPLKLAWAVTIHKSQGLTFDKVVIDAGKAFAYGQVYVALSRCTTFHGIITVSPITADIIKTDPIVVDYMKNARRIVLEGDNLEDDEPEEDEHIVIDSTVDKTYWMVKDGLSISDIVEQTGEKIEIIYNHIAKIVEAGKANVTDFIETTALFDIRSAIRRVGSDSTLLKIKQICRFPHKMGEIQIVLASLNNNCSPQTSISIGETKTAKVTSIIVQTGDTRTTWDEYKQQKAKEHQEAQQRIEQQLREQQALIEQALLASRPKGVIVTEKVSSSVFEKHASGEVCLFRKGIVDKETAQLFVENADSPYIWYSNIPVCPLKAKKIDYLELVCDGKSVIRKVQNISFTPAKMGFKDIWLANVILES